MEADVLEVLLCHGEHIAGVSEEDIASVLVLRHILILSLLETVKFLGIITLHPTGFVEMYRFPTALGVVFVLQTILDDLKLQLSHSADDAAVVELVDKHLCHTLVHQLLQTLLKLFCLHRIIILDVFEQFGRERRQTTEMQLLALGQRVADLEYAVVGQTYDVAGPCLVDGRLALRHKLSRRGEAYGFVLTYMQVRLVSHELARAYLAEGDTRTVVGVDVCCYLEDKSRKLVLVRLYHSLHGLCLSW